MFNDQSAATLRDLISDFKDEETNSKISETSCFRWENVIEVRVLDVSFLTSFIVQSLIKIVTIEGSKPQGKNVITETFWLVSFNVNESQTTKMLQ